jgi:hypothetical protein
MRCLSLHQPWASLLASGAKCVETRSRPLPHRGPLLIHATKTWGPDLAEIAVGPHFRAALERAGIVFEATEEACMRGWGMPFGAIVGRVDVVECYPTERVKVDAGVLTAYEMPTTPPWLGVGPAEHAFGSYSPRRFAILCRNPVRFANPVPYRGERGLFDVPDELAKGATA